MERSRIGAGVGGRRPQDHGLRVDLGRLQLDGEPRLLERVAIGHPFVGVGGAAFVMDAVFEDRLAVHALRVACPVEALRHARLLTVPEGPADAKLALVVREAGDAVIEEAVLVVGCGRGASAPAIAVQVLAGRAPLPLREVRAPAPVELVPRGQTGKVRLRRARLCEGDRGAEPQDRRQDDRDEDHAAPPSQRRLRWGLPGTVSRRLRCHGSRVACQLSRGSRISRAPLGTPDVRTDPWSRGSLAKSGVASAPVVGSHVTCFDRPLKRLAAVLGRIAVSYEGQFAPRTCQAPRAVPRRAAGASASGPHAASASPRGGMRRRGLAASASGPHAALRGERCHPPSGRCPPAERAAPLVPIADTGRGATTFPLGSRPCWSWCR